MRQNVVSVNIDPVAPAENQPGRSFSFRAFRRFLEEQASGGGTKAAAGRYLVQQYRQYPGADDDLEPAQLDAYVGLLETVYMSLTDITMDENRMIWGLSMPFQPQIVYGTEALYGLLEKVLHLGGDGQQAYRVNRKHTPVQYLYAVILKRFFQYEYASGIEEMTHSFIDPEDGLFKYFRFNVDPRFIDIRPIRPLPDLPADLLDAKLCGGKASGFLEKLLPLDGFHLSGFSVITLTDVTAQYVIHLIRNLLIRIGSRSVRDVPEDIRSELVLSLQTLMGSREIHFGIIPLYLLNDRPVMDWGKDMGSVLLDAVKREAMPQGLLTENVRQFIKNPKPIYFSETEDAPADAAVPLAGLMRTAGIRAFALLPILYNQEVTGFLEVYTREKGLDLETRLSRLDNALPYIAQLMRAGVDELDTKISLTVNELYTAVQPAVQWKFKEAALNYLQARLHRQGQAVAETIRFRDVYPLYGAIDIRNSTVERNQALQDDLKFCLGRLSEVLKGLTDDSLAFMKRETQRLLGKLGPEFSESDEHEIGHFLQREAYPALRAVQQSLLAATLADPAGSGAASVPYALIDGYLHAMEEDNGDGYRNRRALEASMQLVNRSIGQYLDQMNEELQRIYPCYFEKFRTDGVEFDLYMGQAIVPARPFEPRFLDQAMVWQLRAMAAIQRLTRALLPRMERPLYTTQLIFINGRTIDISFRNDEKRFDVEGAYNIRYQVIKKRIDKIRIKDSGERLTQPDKIVIVYYWKQDAESYFGHIEALQKEGVLAGDLEQLDLETLQGVSGLKALRISIL
ncbi:MAG TPA: hypothetical protein VL547_05445 [Dinghuibacter sp.]|uniref:hypothetical protein n=1 Tax=Dinghuibacter sp. TaxID=2024697 RepID=UPI002D1A3DD9|nr:hypothetical protein [Dinghuibacter sp.]HTJ11443.1 hypothetical protein [Dinghuibacter sp.]